MNHTDETTTTYAHPSAPTQYDWRGKTCSECAWAGKYVGRSSCPRIEVAYCRRVPWSHHVICTLEGAKVLEAASGLVYRDTPACPAFVPRDEATDDAHDCPTQAITKPACPACSTKRGFLNKQTTSATTVPSVECPACGRLLIAETLE